MAKVETVKVKSDNKAGYSIINKSDFADHVLFVEKKKSTKRKEEIKWPKVEK